MVHDMPHIEYRKRKVKNADGISSAEYNKKLAEKLKARMKENQAQELKEKQNGR